MLRGMIFVESLKKVSLMHDSFFECLLEHCPHDKVRTLFFFAYVWVQNFLSEGNCASMDPGNFLNVVL